jgi:hypothetical protein
MASPNSKPLLPLLPTVRLRTGPAIRTRRFLRLRFLPAITRSTLCFSTCLTSLRPWLRFRLRFTGVFFLTLTVRLRRFLVAGFALRFFAFATRRTCLCALRFFVRFFAFAI